MKTCKRIFTLQRKRKRESEREIESERKRNSRIFSKKNQFFWRLYALVSEL